jgi:hypothetical protein
LILGDSSTANAQGAGSTTLDSLFRQAAARRPDAIALADSPNRLYFTDGAPRRLRYADADHIVSAIAARLRGLGLAEDSVVGVQLANTVESLLTTLGVLRAGMIAAPLPLLWRRAELTAALGRVGARAIVTTARIGEFRPCEIAMQVAAELFTIRHVCAFGENLADGVVPLDGLMAADGAAPPLAEDRSHSVESQSFESIERAGDRVAVVTFDVTPQGHVAVARSHTQMIAGGLAPLLEGRLPQDAVLLGGCAINSFAGLALTMMPWLLTGGTLALHQPFDGLAFSVQCNYEGCDTVVVPGPLVPRLAAANLLSHRELKNVLAVWRAPERLHLSPPWRHETARLTDMLVFGEIALLGSRREPDGQIGPWTAGEVMAPRGAPQAVRLAEIARSPAGTLMLRGPMVPRQPFPPGAESLDAPWLRADADGFVDTGYACRIDRATQRLAVTAPPPGIVSIGGYRFVLRELEGQVRDADGGAAVTALPDAMAGHRLAGVSADGDAVATALAAQGANPLLVDAFRDRRRPRAA